MRSIRRKLGRGRNSKAKKYQTPAPQGGEASHLDEADFAASQTADAKHANKLPPANGFIQKDDADDAPFREDDGQWDTPPSK